MTSKRQKQAWMSRLRGIFKVGFLFSAAAAMTALAGCDDSTNPNDYPVSHWLDDGEECTRVTAAAIIKSGLPFPNYGVEEEPAATAGEPPKRRIKTVDIWLADVRFVIPAEVAAIDGGYPEHHPRRYQGLQGSLPNFYPPGPPGPEIDGMGSRVDVKFVCVMDPKYVTTWGKGRRSIQDSVAAVKADYEENLRRTPKHPGTVTVNQRDDIGMIEVLLDRDGEANGQRRWEATYWPINGELRGGGGALSGIGCKMRHDPIEHRYGKRGWTCGSGIRLTPHGGVQIEIYVTHIQQMPAIFEQVKQLLFNAQQPSGK